MKPGGLALRRRLGESISLSIGGKQICRITIEDILKNKVDIRIRADEGIKILRDELNEGGDDEVDPVS